MARRLMEHPVDTFSHAASDLFKLAISKAVKGHGKKAVKGHGKKLRRGGRITRQRDFWDCKTEAVH